MTVTGTIISQILAKSWTDIVVAGMAVAAFIVSVGSFKVSLQALRLSQRQDDRKQPKLSLSLLDSYFESLPETGRLYSFLLSLGNPTDSDNAVAQIEMHLSYVIEDNILMTVKLPPSLADFDSYTNNHPRLRTPFRITAHDTASGWCNFLIAPGVLGGRRVESYQIVVTDSHLAETSVDAFVVSEKRHAE